MPSLTTYIAGRLTAAGFDPAELEAVRWWDDRLRVWLHLGVHQIRPAADNVEVTAMPDSVRERLQFVVGGANTVVFAWDATAGQFERVPAVEDVELSEADLLGT